MIGAVQAPTFVSRVEDVAKTAWDVSSWPEDDLAAVMGWNTGWLIMILGMMKVVSVGLHHERKARGPIFKR